MSLAARQARKRWDDMVALLSTAAWVIGQPHSDIMRIAVRPGSLLPDLLS